MSIRPLCVTGQNFSVLVPEIAPHPRVNPLVSTGGFTLGTRRAELPQPQTPVRRKAQRRGQSHWVVCLNRQHGSAVEVLAGLGQSIEAEVEPAYVLLDMAEEGEGWRKCLTSRSFSQLGCTLPQRH